MAHSMLGDGPKYNEEKKPLEDIVLIIKENGSSQRVPALNIRFSTPRSMTMYMPPPKKEVGKNFVIGAKEEWLERISLCVEDFEWLLGLSHHRFWSQLVFQKKTWVGLISFLQESYPFYALDQLPDDNEIKSAYFKVASLVFSLIIRITTRVESETEWISEKKYSTMLYEMFIISVPMLLDFCVLYGPSNEKEVKRIINYIFKVQPAYRDDFAKCVDDVKTLYRQIVDKLTGFGNADIIRLNGSESVRDEITISQLDDIVFFLLDVTVSISSFTEMYSGAAEIMHYQHLESVIVSVYQKIINSVLGHIKRLYSGNVALISTVECRLNLVRYYLLKLFHQSISVPLRAILEQRDQLTEGAVKTFADGYMGVMNESLSEKEFIKDYNLLYPIDSDLEIIMQACPEIETYSLLEAIATCYEGPKKSGKTYYEEENASGGREIEIPCDKPSTSVKYTGIELESLITEVKDILPHLGAGFIKKCLEQYNYSSSSVINAILENTLPDDLLSLDPELIIIPDELTDYCLPTSNLPDRVNVYDNDEFDIMTRDHIDMDKVHKGKRKDKFKDLKDLIDDKTHREELRDTFTKLGNVEYLDDVYDDEYDDTYDSVDVAIEEPGEPEKRPFVVPRVLQKNTPRVEEQDEEEESDHEEQNGHARTDKFLEDPAVLRARAEAKRLLKQMPRGVPPPRTKDVVGRTKGQGQEKEVLLNRQRKAQHKSSQSNHNRRKMAQHKRQQGMLHT